MKIGVYVGSFNPVHIGHIKIVNHLIHNNYCDKVVIVPTGNYWNKQDLVNIADRINMLKTYESDFVIINTELNDLTYTYQIFEELSKNNHDDFSLIIGADNIVDFNKWKNYKFLNDFNLIIINRDGIDVKYYLKKHNIKKYTLVSDLPPLDISSTMIRDLIKRGKHEEVLKFIDVDVLKYIEKNNLYKNGW